MSKTKKHNKRGGYSLKSNKKMNKSKNNVSKSKRNNVNKKSKTESLSNQIKHRTFVEILNR